MAEEYWNKPPFGERRTRTVAVNNSIAELAPNNPKRRILVISSDPTSPISIHFNGNDAVGAGLDIPAAALPFEMTYKTWGSGLTGQIFVSSAGNITVTALEVEQ